MLYSTAGSRLFIADKPVEYWRTEPVTPTTGWIEIADAEAFGVLGVEWSLEESATIFSDTNIAKKGLKSFRPMQIVVGNNPPDPGQILVRKALLDVSAYPFRLDLPDTVSKRFWFAIVFGMNDVFDTANSLMRVQIDLKPVTSASSGA